MQQNGNTPEEQNLKRLLEELKKDCDKRNKELKTVTLTRIPKTFVYDPAVEQDELSLDERLYMHLAKFYKAVKYTYKILHHKDLESMAMHWIFEPVRMITLAIGDDFNTENKVVGWNLKCVGKYDCSLVGCIFAWAYENQYYENGVATGRSICEEFDIGFSRVEDYWIFEEDEHTFFKKRLDRPTGIHGWVIGRVGRMKDKSCYPSYTLDTKNKDKMQKFMLG